MVIKGTVTTYGSSTSAATAYGFAGNQYSTGYGSATAIGLQSTMQTSSSWPAEVFFRLEPTNKGRED